MDSQLVPHLFRTEYGKIVAVLVRRFGFDQVGLAEDIASETFLAALETWPYRGVPEQPVAWLYQVAKNKAKNAVMRLGRESELAEEFAVQDEIDLSDSGIRDGQLRMMFAVCHPAIAPEAQVGLALRILCGFGIEEIADAFLTNKETINKRLYRAKETLRKERIEAEFPGFEEVEARLVAVLATLYLLFSEGYYSDSHEEVLREDVCLEAMRLTELLLTDDRTNQPQTRALLALMCFHASRFAARRGSNGDMVLYDDQDRSRWNQELVARGAKLLQEASVGDQFSKYHLEAGIAFWHSTPEESTQKWESILMLHNQLLVLEYSPVAALNRTYALSKVKGATAAIEEAEKLKLENNRFYFALLGELYCEIDHKHARAHFERALALAKTEQDQRIIQHKIENLSL